MTPVPMHREELQAILDAWGWTARKLALESGCSPNIAKHWQAGRGPIPQVVADKLRARHAAMAALPAVAQVSEWKGTKKRWTVPWREREAARVAALSNA